MDGLFKRGKYWHVHKTVSVPPEAAIGAEHKTVIACSTGTTNKKIAQAILRKMEENAAYDLINGKSRHWVFDDAAKRYLDERRERRSWWEDCRRVDHLLDYLKDVPLRLVDGDHEKVKQLVADCQAKGNAPGTINHHLKVIIAILNSAHSKWKDENKAPMLARKPYIQLLPTNPVKGFPLTQGQEKALLNNLNADLKFAVLFTLHTGLRNATVCNLKWDFLIHYPDEDILCFDIPENYFGLKVKDRPHRVVLNSMAREIVERKLGEHEEYVFTYATGRYRKPYSTLYTSSWIRAVDAAGLSECRSEGRTARGRSGLRIHDLRHSFSTRLRTLGVGLEDRKDLMGHKNKDITTGYSAAETQHLLDCVEKLVDWYQKREPLYVARGQVGLTRKSATPRAVSA